MIQPSLTGLVHALFATQHCVLGYYQAVPAGLTLGKLWWFASTCGHDGTLSRGDPVPYAGRPGDSPAESAGGKDPAARCGGPGVSESIYLSDPDDNGVELYCDKPKELWPRTPDGELAMFTRRLDLRELLSEAPSELEVDSGPRDL
jgi:hypothetical protein